MDRYVQSVDRCLDWIEREMLSFDRGRVGVYERIRIDVHQRVSWTRPDCNSEIARVYMKRNRKQSADSSATSAWTATASAQRAACVKFCA